jgi:hypothetical protein
MSECMRHGIFSHSICHSITTSLHPPDPSLNIECSILQAAIESVTPSPRHPVHTSRLQLEHAAMPHYSDNLYSAEDSDQESFSDELSPTDGYFNRGAMAANAMVPDPSIEDTKAEAKTLMPPHLQESAGRGSRISNHPSSLPSQSYASARSTHNSFPSRASYTPVSPVSSRQLDDLFPRRPASINGPPPAYSVAPESRRTLSSQEPTGRSYSTFPEQHLQRGLFPRRDPESMGSPEEEANESTPLSRESMRRSPCRKIIRNLLLAALILAVTTTLLSAIFRGLQTVSSSFPFQRPW